MTCTHSDAGAHAQLLARAWQVLSLNCQLSSSQEALRVARGVRLNDQNIIIAKCEEVRELRERMQQAVEKLDNMLASKTHTGVIPCPQDYSFYIQPLERAISEAISLLSPEGAPKS